MIDLNWNQYRFLDYIPKINYKKREEQNNNLQIITS